MKITHVLIRKSREEPNYVCEPRGAFFKCGCCQRGNLGPLPKKGQQCRVCKARVTQVITDRVRCSPSSD